MRGTFKGPVCALVFMKWPALSSGGYVGTSGNEDCVYHSGVYLQTYTFLPFSL